MATISNQYDPNDPNSQSNSGGSGTVMPSTSGGSTTVGGGGGTTTANQSQASSAPNVQSYLNANQGAGQQLTQGITNNVQNQASKVNQGVSSAQSNLDKQYQPLANNLNSTNAQGIAQTAFKDPQALLDSYNAAKTQSSSTPLSANQQQNQSQYNQFQQLNNGGYNSQIQNYGNAAQAQNSNLQAQAANINQDYGNTANEMGRGALLQKAVGNPNYNQGQQTLDTLFLQGQPGQTNSNGLSNLQQLQQNLKGISNTTNQGVQSLGSNTSAKLQALQGLSSQDQQYIKNLFTNGQATNSNDVNNMGLNSIATNAGNQYDTAQANANLYQPQLKNDLTSGNVTSEDLSLLGIQPGTQTWGVGNLQNYLTTNTLNAKDQGGLAQTATPEEFARYNALNQLAGGANGPLQTSAFGTATTAGGYSPYSFDTSRFNTAVDSAKQALTGSDLTNAVSGIGGSWNSGLINQINSAVQAGTMTPEQANEAIENQKASDIYQGQRAVSEGGATTDFGAINAEYSPFENYYNNTYLPASKATIGKTST